VEAGVRSGEPERAEAALARLAEMTSAAGTDWALGAQALAEALLREGAAAEERYREAIARLGRAGVTPLLARAKLLYGEALRRDRRRRDARDALTEAHGLFTAMGALAFAERSARELGATGPAARPWSDEARDGLTEREQQIAGFACDGLTNAEIGTRLFISPRTVEYHLGKVFSKLGIRSRAQLGDALARAALAPGPVR
jgi:ATP/maltotriose-dependent transcriptional regulator MalT